MTESTTSIIYLDTNVFIKAVEGTDEAAAPAKRLTVARLKLPDAVHLVCAKRSGCRFFVSTDKDFDRLPQGMERVDPDENGLSRLIRELS
jgi:predicted nucleic acid-binding protein